jgi:lambda family phage portal protein
MKLIRRIRNAVRAFRWEGAELTESRAQTPSNYSNHAESASTNRGRVQLIWEARDLENNHPLVSGILRKLTLYTLGSLRYQARTSDPAINSAYESFFAEWCKRADFSGRFDFLSLMQLAFVSFVRDGDCLLVKSLTEDGPRLQLIEADRIGNPYHSTIADDLIGGIRIDVKSGRPVAYQITRRSMGASYVDEQEVPAERCLHLFDPQRHDSYRGVSAFAPAIATCKDIVEILAGEKDAVKWASRQTGVVKTPSGEGLGWDEQTTTGDSIERITPGTIHYLKPGEEVTGFMSNRPSVTFTGFLESLQRHLADALGLPYGFFIDPSNLGGVTARLDSQQAARVCGRYQRILTNRILDPILEAVIAFGISNGDITQSAEWRAHRWQFPPWPSTDIGRETYAELAELKQGGSTFAEYYASKGEDWEEAFIQSANERKRRAEIFAAAGVDDPLLILEPDSGGSQPGMSSAEESTQFAEDSFEPPQAVRAAAARALRERAKKPASQRGMTPVGIARARDLANGRPVSADTVRRMKAYFDRHEGDKQGTTWDDYGKGRQAWDGWGGDAGQAWANRIVERLNKTA